MSDPQRIIHSFNTNTEDLVNNLAKFMELACKRMEQDMARDKERWDAIDALNKTVDAQFEKINELKLQLQKTDAQLEGVYRMVRASNKD